MKQIRTMPKRLSAILAATVLMFWIAYPVISNNLVHAGQLQSRSLKLSSSANGTITTDIAGNAVAAGAGGNGQKTKHTIKFTFATNNATDGSILVMYCDDPIPQATCNTPTGMTATNLTAYTLIQGSTNLSTTNAYTLDTTTTNATINTAIGALGVCNGATTVRTNCIALKRSSAATETGLPDPSFAFGGGSSDYITNPTTDNYSFFARIYIFSNTSWTNANLVDYGSVAGAVAQQIDITAKVKEVLNFSVGDFTSLVAPGAVCTPLGAGTNGAVALGDVNGVLAFTTAYDVHTYFRLSTNTNGGVIVYYSGDTLKNGSNSIAAINSAGNPNTSPGTAAFSLYGSPQFGLAIDSSDTQGGNGYSFTNLAAGAQYNTGNGNIQNPATSPGTATGAKFAFDTTSTTTPVSFASSANPVGCDTGSVRYIGNISTATPAGIYTTTITYIATGTY